MSFKKITAGLLSVLLAGTFAVSSWTTSVEAASTRVETILSNMTLRQKITQMLMVDFRYWDSDLSDGEQSGNGYEFTDMNPQVQKIVEDYDFGAIIYFAQNIQETKQSYELSMALQEAATKDGGIPLIISADQEGGSVYRLGSGTALPGNMALGATNNVDYAEEAGRIIGSELSVLGINTNLAPVVDVNNNANNPVIGLRSYSDDATIVGNMASATIAGLASQNVIGCAKHFPGHGDTATDSHYGLPVVNKTKDELLTNELKPYEIAINQGIEMIMTAHILYPELDNTTVLSDKTGKQESLPATMSKKILTDLLKDEMGFEGIISTDAMNMAGVANTFDQVQAVKLAIAAGVDMICMPCVLYNEEDLKDLDAIIDGVEEAVKNNEIPMSRIDDAVTRILTVKENRGILDYDSANYSLEKAEAVVGSDVNRQSEREIAAAAVTVIKNTDNILPLTVNEDSKVLMLCPYDNEKAQMVMGWNRAKEVGIVPKEAEVKVVRFSNSTTVESIQKDLDWADTIIINSEISNVSRFNTNHWLYSKTNSFVDYAHSNNKKSIVMSVDKPYDVQMYDNADAILAVYGCKGSSVDVTEALTGGVTSSKAAYGPNIIAGIEVALGTFGASGTLPVAIPKYDGTSGEYLTDNILYPRGYGLTYASSLRKAELQETIDSVNDLDSTKYTEESWATLETALNEAITVMESASATDAEVMLANEKLGNAIESLALIETKPVEKPDTETTTPETTTPETENNKDKVDTGDTTNVNGLLALVALSAGAVVILRKKYFVS